MALPWVFPVKEPRALRLVRPFRLVAALALALSAGGLAVAVARKAPSPKPPAAAPAEIVQASPPPPWLRVEYGALLDRRRLTHSGEPVGALLNRLGGRPFPSPGERAEDALLFCPELVPPRNRVVQKRSGNLQRLGRSESLFTKFSSLVGKHAPGSDAVRD